MLVEHMVLSHQGQAVTMASAPTDLASSIRSMAVQLANSGNPSHTPPPVPSPTPSLTPIPSPTPTFAGPSTLNLLYAPAGDDTTGRIRGRLFFPSEYVPPLTVYAVAIDGSRFYRVNTEEVPPGEPNYEISGVKPGLYYVYSYPIEDPGEFGGSYSYLAACEAGHLESPPENCWEDPQYDLVPVEVRAGEAVEEIDIFDWYGPSLPPPPDDTTG